MIRTATLAALAVAAVGLPASAAIPTAYVSTQGKTPAEVRAEVRAAAEQLCEKAQQGVVLPLEARSACVSDAVKVVMRQAALTPAIRNYQ